MQKRGDRGDVLVLILGAFFPLGDCLYLALPLRNIFDKTKNGQMIAQSSSGPSKKAMTFYMLIAFVIGGIMLSSIVQSQCIS